MDDSASGFGSIFTSNCRFYFFFFCSYSYYLLTNGAWGMEGLSWEGFADSLGSDRLVG